MKSSSKLVYTWGIFLQSDGTLIDTAKSRIGCVSKARHLARGSFYIDKFVAP
jgi:hypothetical protein